MTLRHLVRRSGRWGGRAVLLAAVLLLGKTVLDFHAPYPTFQAVRNDRDTLTIVDRSGTPLAVSYQQRWNTHDVIALHQVPELMQHAFVAAEDKRFFEHAGVDWAARGSALWQRLRHGDHSRGASSITEQVVRMLHPRPRSYWSKWIEGLEALALEHRTSKADILEFYFNQVPYASNRRGVVQAAMFYFGRDITTLSPKEMLALAVLVRAPSRFDLYAGQVKIDDSIARLGTTLVRRGELDSATLEPMRQQVLELRGVALPVEAFHFVDYVREHSDMAWNNRTIVTTLDAYLQRFTTELLESRLQALASKTVNHAAAVIVDHRTHEILAWVSVGARCKTTKNKADGCAIDMVTVPRQPGSALKPFLYAAALEKGWTAATMINDSPYSDSVGRGIHHFRNYSRQYYGKVSLRTALGNSLNIPALHAIKYITPPRYLMLLQSLGFERLLRGAEYYDEGLALGNGEVTLFELVRAYTALANRGHYAQLKIALYDDTPIAQHQVISEEVASLISNILSDPWARSLEFGRGSVLNFPTQTAVKTGTSTDYRDAWAVGYNYRYVVGIWMGNADYTPTDGITGSLGPSLALRGIFNELTQDRSGTAPLYLSPKLIPKDVCIDPKDAENGNPHCATYTEYFMPDHMQPAPPKPSQQRIALIRPAEGLNMAFDPRIPPEKQAFEMRLAGVRESDEVEWIIDRLPQPKTRGPRLMWPISKGEHQVQAIVWRDGRKLTETKTNRFIVK